MTGEWTFDESFITEVEVKFTPMSESRTRVALEHRNLERFGAKEEAISKSVDGGWTDILKSFAATVEAGKEYHATAPR